MGQSTAAVQAEHTKRERIMFNRKDTKQPEQPAAALDSTSRTMFFRSINANHSVKGHVRKDGAYVPPHRQSNADKYVNNNWSTKPNRNPYTDKEGTRTNPERK